MNDIMVITPVEWVFLALATVALVHAAVICIQLRASLATSRQRPAFKGLLGSMKDVSQRKDGKTTS